MNKYFENEKQINELQKNIDLYTSQIKNLTKIMNQLKEECNHTHKDGSTSITWKNDGGHGHIIYTCGLCGKWGSRYSFKGYI